MTSTPEDDLTEYINTLITDIGELGTVTITGTLASWRRSRTWASGELVTYRPGTTTVTGRLTLGVAGRPAAAIEARTRDQGSPLQAGIDISVTGRPELHPVYGFRFHAFKIEPLAISQRALQRARTLQELTDTGLLTRQQTLTPPTRISRVGILTPVAGEAARQDTLTILNQPVHELTVEERRVPVAGPSSVRAITKGILDLTHAQPDVILIVRGGGEASDIGIWDSPILTRSIAATPIPVIVGIGHRTDTPLTGRVAHTDAGTPTGAAHWVITHNQLTPAVTATQPPQPRLPVPHYLQPAETRDRKALIVAVPALATALAVTLILLAILIL